jgi:eukaryotic-like serine/threonine-protein kinase
MVCPRCGQSGQFKNGHCVVCGASFREGVTIGPTHGGSVVPTSGGRPSAGDAPTLLPGTSVTPINTRASDSHEEAEPATSFGGFAVGDGEALTGFVPPGNDGATIPPGAPPVSHSEDPSGPLEPGQSFGPRYHIIRALGVGGMGAVYQAWDAELGVTVAIKVIRPDVMADPTAAAEIERRFKRELLLARQVTHKNVVRIHDLGDINGIKYITMPYVDGADLASVLKNEGRLPINRVMRIARSVVSGLVEAHKAGVVHRDLKPANIMIGPEDEALIMDFGIARSTGAPAGHAVPGANTIVRNLKSSTARLDATVFGAVVGTVEYMAPEQAKGIHVDQRADIYAFGLILYDLLVGKSRVAGGINPIEELKGRMAHAPAPVKTLALDVPDRVDQIISRCLEPDADKRFQTTEELATALALLDDEGEPIPVPPRFSKKLIALAAVAVLGLVTGTWYFTRTPPPEKPHDPVSVVISDLQNRTGDPAFDRTIEPVIKLALEGAGFISAYDRPGIRRSLGVRLPDKLDERAGLEIAVKQGVGVVVSGAVERAGSGFQLSVKAVQAVTGKVISEATAKASDKERVLALATKLATNVRKSLGDNASDSAQRFAMDTLTATSLDAVHDYAIGQEALSNNRNEEAIENYLKAVARDKNFGAAYTGLAIASGNVGRQQDADKYAKEALRHLDGMTERERYRTRGIFYRVTSDYQNCVNEYGALVQRYAADAAARNNMALCLSNLRQLPKARDEMRRVVEILPKRALYRINLSLYASYGTDFDTGEAEARAAQELSPSAEYAYVALAFAQLGQSKLAEATETYRKLETVSTLGASLAASGLADIALYEGRLSEAAGIYERGAADDVAAKNPDRAATKFAALAQTQLLRRQNRQAIAAADRALDSSKVSKIRFFAARVFVETGETAKAKALAKSLGDELQAEPQALGKIVEAEMALKSKDSKAAIKLLSDANALLDTWIARFDLGRAYLDAGAFTQADSEFDRCIKRRGEALALFLDEEPTFGIAPAVYYYQGRAREGQNTAGFADSYKTYLTIRDKAGEDPLLPEVRKRATK